MPSVLYCRNGTHLRRLIPGMRVYFYNREPPTAAGPLAAYDLPSFGMLSRSTADRPYRSIRTVRLRFPFADRICTI